MNSTATKRDRLAWQARGRCTNPQCGLKIAGCRRVTACPCGGKVRYR